MRTKLSNKLWGLFLLVIGFLIVGNIFDFWNVTLFFDGWWTLIIIIPCVISIIDKGFHLFSTILLTIGILLLLLRQDVIDLNTTNKLIVPIIFILIGLGMILKSLFRNDLDKLNNKNTEYEIHSNNSGNNYSSIFSTRKIYIPQGEFNGANLHSTFGELYVDLSTSKITQDAVIHCTATFGEIKLQVPHNVTVKVSGAGFLSSINNRCNSKNDIGLPIIYVVSHSCFGEITIN